MIMWGLRGGTSDEGNLTCGGEWTIYYTDAELENTTLGG